MDRSSPISASDDVHGVMRWTATTWAVRSRVEWAEPFSATALEEWSGGLSLGNRYCLALAKREGVPALAAERRWPAIAAVAGVTVELIL